MIAIPPCIWTASAATFENASLAATRASAAEVEDDLEGSEDESVGGATPARSSIHSAIFGSAPRGRTASPPPAVPALPRAVMVDSATMTDPLDNTRDSYSATLQLPGAGPAIVRTCSPGARVLGSGP